MVGRDGVPHKVLGKMSRKVFAEVIVKMFEFASFSLVLNIRSTVS